MKSNWSEKSEREDWIVAGGEGIIMNGMIMSV